MDFLNLMLAAAPRLLGGEHGRLLATTLVALACTLGFRGWQRYLSVKGGNARASQTNRERLVWSKNVFWAIGAVSIATIWATKIAGLALTLTALFGATLIVSKELVLCFIGYGVIVINRPYRLGDFIELGGNEGKVIDVTVFSTTLAETGSVHQLTGKTLAFPNSQVLTTAVKNVSATGTYMVNLYRLAVPMDIDIELASDCVLHAAECATTQWQKGADSHFERIEAMDYVTLPSSRPKVLWETVEATGHILTIRFACPLESRVNAEQLIFRQFWKSYNTATAKKTSSPRRTLTAGRGRSGCTHAPG